MADGASRPVLHEQSFWRPEEVKVRVALERVLNITLWVLKVLLALLFLFTGVGKWNPKALFWIELFDRIGIGQWARYLTGGLEITCAILLLIPRTSAVAATILSATMVGAFLIHLFILRDGFAAFFPAFTFVLSALVVWKRSR